MGIKLKKIQKQNPQNHNEVKWYLTQEKTGTVNLQEVSVEIARNSSLSAGDIRSALMNLVEVMPTFLHLGQSVNLDGFGSFHLSVSSEGADTAEQLSVHNIKSVKLVFTPSTEFKRNLSNLSFETIKSN